MTADPSQSPRLNTPNPANYSSPSVPISVYKQLAGELNVTKSEVAALKSENQQLRANNQKLQQQVHQVIQAAEHLKQMVNRYDFGADSYQVNSLTPPPASSLATTPPLPPHPELWQPRPAPEPPRQMMPEPVVSRSQPLPEVVPPAPPPQDTPQKSSRKPKAAPLTTVPAPDLPSHGEDIEGGVNGWIILLAAIAIILTAFGAGYMVVLPLLNNSNNPPSNPK